MIFTPKPATHHEYSILCSAKNIEQDYDTKHTVASVCFVVRTLIRNVITVAPLHHVGDVESLAIMLNSFVMLAGTTGEMKS